MRHVEPFVAHEVTAITERSLRSNKPCLPVEVYVFKRGKEYYAFDVRNFAILRIGALDAEVLSRAGASSIGQMCDVLAGTIPEHKLNAAYQRVERLLALEVLSSAPLPRPQRPPFSRLTLMLAGGCNLACTYCCARQAPIYQDANLMKKETAISSLAWFRRHFEGRRGMVWLFGGEPTLNWSVLQDVVRTLRNANEWKGIDLKIFLLTNGVLLDKQRIAFLREHDIATQVSTDGDALTHDRFRVSRGGMPTMCEIRPNILELKNQGCDFTTRAVLTHLNRDPIEVTRGQQRLGFQRVSFEVAATETEGLRFTDEDWEYFNSRYTEYVNAPFSAWANIAADVQATILRISEQRRLHYGCAAGVFEVTIDPDGATHDCHWVYRTPRGTICDDPGPAHRPGLLQEMVDDRPVCRSCWARYLCGGGCMHQVHLANGSDSPMPQYCQMKRTTVEAAIVKIHEIRKLAVHPRNGGPHGEN